MGTRHGALAALNIAVVLALVLPASSMGAEVIGADLTTAANAPTAGGIGHESSPVITGRTTLSPIDGVITSWRFHGRASTGTVNIRLRVVRGEPDNCCTFKEASTDVAISTTGQIWGQSGVGIPVAAGDAIALRRSNAIVGYQSGVASSNLYRTWFDPCCQDPADEAFVPANGGGSSNILKLQATIEPDADGDALGDETQDDDDGDGVFRAFDNCPLAANPDQANNDGDAAGDVCDADDDNDGVNDPSDNCPLTANPSQTDADGDGAGAACDTNDTVASGAGGTGGGGTGGGVTGGPGALDLFAPIATVSGARKQRIRNLAVTVALNEPGTVRIRGTLNVPGVARRFRLATISRTLAANRRTRIPIRLRKRHRQAALRALRRGKKPSLTLTITAIDAAGNRSVSKKKIQLKL